MIAALATSVRSWSFSRVNPTYRKARAQCVGNPKTAVLELMRLVKRLSYRTIACLVVASSPVFVGCGHIERKLIFDKTIDMPTGRFTGPIDIDVPKRAEHNNRDFEVTVSLRSACGPLLKFSTPDGEVWNLGEEHENWQAWLAKRALAGPAADAAPGAPGTSGQSLPTGPGHWQTVQTESWPGQLTFLQIRAQRCAESNTYDFEYLNAFDESSRMTFWADPPQEIANAKLSIKFYEVIDVRAELEAKLAAEAEAKARVSGSISVSGSVGVTIEPTSPMPPPKKENPPPAKAEGATWVPGHWAWSVTPGEWIWIPGHWNAPTTTPGPMAENTSNPPNPGCTWSPGYWVWVPGNGSWKWVPGHWNAPPPKLENPGPPPVPESDWVAGYWVEVNGKFEWVVGHWGKPRPRAETPPPKPSAAARWVEGVWVYVNGKWVWSPGYWERSGRPPPAPKAETPPPSPAPGSVWLSGFWRWNDAKSDYEWISGHWEVPPGEGYVWVADPADPRIGISISGHWELKVKVKPNGTLEVKP